MKNKAVMLILSVILAFGLWLYVVSAVNPEFEDSYHNIPVVLVGEGLLEERGLMITSNENPTISLKLKGNRTDLVELKSSDISVTVDVSKISCGWTIRKSSRAILPTMRLRFSPEVPVPLPLWWRRRLPRQWMW